MATRKLTPESARCFERYSVANAVTVKEALPCGCEPYRDVFTYRRWLAQGYQVQRGEQAIRLPLIYQRKVKDPETGEERTVQRKGRSAVFCRCQVRPREGSRHLGDCPSCGGRGEFAGGRPCRACDGTGLPRAGVNVTGPTTIREAVVRYRGGRRRAPEMVRNPADVARFIRQVVGSDAREHFIVLLLDARHRPIAYQVASIGTATASLVHPREVFQTAVSLGAVGVIVGHNHPSGDPRPSDEDRTVADRLIRAGELLGILVLDSVVVAEWGYVSMREEEPGRFNSAR